MTPSIIKHDRVRLDAADAAHGEPSAATQAASAAPARHRLPKGVRLLERDGRVHAIELVCSCGETSVIELDYAAARTGTTQGPSRPEETR